jgi:hypothetical protein
MELLRRGATQPMTEEEIVEADGSVTKIITTNDGEYVTYTPAKQRKQ